MPINLIRFKINEIVLWSSGKGQARIGKGWQSRRKASKLKPLPRAYIKVGCHHPPPPPTTTTHPEVSIHLTNGHVMARWGRCVGSLWVTFSINRWQHGDRVRLFQQRVHVWRWEAAGTNCVFIILFGTMYSFLPWAEQQTVASGLGAVQYCKCAPIISTIQRRAARCLKIFRRS